MRISTYYTYQSSVTNLQKRQQDLATAQSQLTSGKRVSQPGDDPVAASQVVLALAAQSRVAAQTTAMGASQTDMQLAESTLGNAGTLLQQARDLVVQAGDGSYNDAGRASLAQQLQGLRNDLLAQANQSDGTGRYLFGGQGSDGVPFVDGPTGVTYNGVAGQQNAVSSQAMPLTVDGQAAWMQTPDPSNPGSNVSVFTALDRTIAQLNTPGQTGAQISATVSQGLASIDAVSGTLSSARAAAGQALNTATNLGNQLGQAKLSAQTQQTNAQDLDMVAAISAFQAKQTGYSAALQTYSLVQQMSLFQYIK